MLGRIIRLQSSVYWAGIILLLISTLVLIVTPVKGTDESGFFIINYVLTSLYFFMLLFHKNRLVPAAKIFHWIVLFALLLVSAWALNRSIPVFESSVPWLTVVQALVCLTMLISAFFRFLPSTFNHLCAAILGFGLPVFVYLSFYTLPLYFLSLFAAIALGISLHSFAPILITVATIVLVVKMVRSRKNYLYSFLAGLGLAIIITAVYCIQWTTRVNSINSEYRRVLANENSDIPLWLQLAQRIPQGDYTRKILKAGIVYVQTDMNDLNLFWDTPSKKYNESKKHDPLITFASLFTHLDIGDDDKIKILESAFNNRHEAEERLWSGDHLVTDHIFTHVQVWSALQLSYTEKTITVKNTTLQGHWPQSEEAIYTFYLPEGSVVSSLSLWTDGIERKGVLTTKEKATEAYRSIVQVERRDPSVVHWQEGNTVSVRVFPVMAGSNRVFKIGITSPLVKRGDHVFYQNAWFKGPAFSGATEIIHTKLDALPENLSIPQFFAKKGATDYEYDGGYKNYWEIEYPEKNIERNSFVFQGKSYSIEHFREQFENKVFTKFFLDINSSWTESELQSILNKLRDKSVFVYKNGIEKIDTENASELYKQLHENKFSLFPVYKISDPENSLLITKSDKGSPAISDLKGSPFAEKLKTFFKEGKKINVIDFGDDLPPYLRTLREYRVLRYEKRNLEALQNEINSNVFAADQEGQDSIVLNDARLIIKRADTTTDNKTNAPDHLLRLFAYNDIMRQMERPSTDSTDTADTIIKEAEFAHIVSPVSSMIVLETQADYDRFNIHDSKEGLENASHKKAGAVPEPGEWILLILVVLLALYLFYSHRLKRVSC